MPSVQELQPLVTEPREALDAEYKGWLNLTTNDHKAVLAKAAIAIANHGGGYIIIGLEDQGHQLVGSPRPADIPEVSQDAVNAAIHRFATPEFHCEVYNVQNPASGVVHPVIVVPGNITEPIMSKRECQGVIAQNRCYIRKPGPRSEEPQTGEEWRALLRRCVRAGRDDMLEAIRSIVSGRVEAPAPIPDATAHLHAFCEAARARWEELTADMPEDAPARFPHGYYEMGFSLVGAQPAASLVQLQERLGIARRIRLTGWSTFLDMATRGWAPYPHDNFVEAWVGRPVREDWMQSEPAHCDFWRASLDGKLYTIRGYAEDGLPGRVAPGAAIDVTLPVWRIGEGILFASRLAETFEDVDAVAIECRFTGLMNRHLSSIDGSRAVFNDRTSQTGEIALTARATPDQIRDNLAEVMHGLLTPLYERFEFFSLPFELVDTELARMRRGRF